ncbi:MAG: hypothetical protein WBG50_23450 [Desulfomonilaceae bacterium]
MSKILSIGKRPARTEPRTGSWGLRWLRPRSASLAGISGATGIQGRLCPTAAVNRFSFLFIALMFVTAFHFIPSLWADDFEESPPPWEVLLWGGAPSAEQQKAQPQLPRDKRTPEKMNRDLPVSGAVAKQTVTTEALSPESTENPESWSDRLGKQFSTMLAPPRGSSILLKPAIEMPGDYSRAPFRSVSLKNIPPLYVTPALPGEGVWQSAGLPTGKDGIPVVYRTSYRPSAEYPNAIAHMLVFDMKQLSMKLYIGSAEPGGSSQTATVDPADKPQLVAITNALWKQKHSGEAGTIFRGTVLKKLAPGMATIVVYNDDSMDILEWNDGIPTSLVRDARQLRHLIVKDGKVVDSVMKGGKRADSEIGLGFLLSEDVSNSNSYWGGYWGGYGGGEPTTNYGEGWFIATRSAFGIRKDGNLVFAVGHHISTKDLAKALVLAGCERAVHGDANPHNVVGNLYYGNGGGEIVKRVKLSPEQKNYTLERYDRSYTSDFFGFFLKREEGHQL